MRNGLSSLGSKVLLDALIYSPLSVAGYVAFKSKLEGNNADSVMTDVTTKVWPGLLASWSFWPAANLFNFALVPLQFRVLYNNFLSLGWNAILWNLTSQQEHFDTATHFLEERLAMLHEARSASPCISSA
eukprot:CAMPEP_0179118672 /NCGR_PEP_ID=MMETSP0796-20121207/55826_1 /TAXON_ID=73915 /ORGANISM="Pyrodinium bahamense, Strain pbaha01" /LENGTH=129 /DNA_ID=CAMNT_0020817141 /DNA_START=374 /DNA_END=763 /DNA_ORIENTATION=-